MIWTIGSNDYGWWLSLKGRGFESRRHILDGHYILSYWFVVKIVLFVWKDQKINEKEAGFAPLQKIWTIDRSEMRQPGYYCTYRRKDLAKVSNSKSTFWKRTPLTWMFWRRAVWKNAFIYFPARTGLLSY